MRYVIKFLAVAMILSVSAGCRTSRALISEKSTSETEQSGMQAKQALADGRFTISPEEFHFSSAETPLKYATEDFITVNDSRATLYIPWDLFRGSTFRHDGISKYTSELSTETPTKDGDSRFCLKLCNGNDCMFRIPITLYRGTNRCFIQIYREFSGEHICNVRGFIRPLKE